MTNAVLPATKKAGLDAILATGTPRAYLIDTAAYTYSSAHAFLSDIPGGARVGSPVALTNVTTTGGVLDADDISFTGLSAPTIEAIAIVVDTGTESTSRILTYLDGKMRLTIAAAASSGAVAITVDPLVAAVASGGTLTKVSGAGGSPSTITTSASGAEGVRTLAVTALSASVSAGDVYEFVQSGVGLPVAAGATQVNAAWSNGTNKIFAL